MLRAAVLVATAVASLSPFAHPGVNFTSQPPVAIPPPPPPGGASSQQPSPEDRMRVTAQMVRGARAITPAQAAEFEERLKTSPHDRGARVLLLGYYFSTGVRTDGVDAAKAARRRHIIWMIENRPDDEVAMLSEMTIDPAGHQLADPDGYQAAKAAWTTQIRKPSAIPPVLLNAANFFRLHDKALALECLKRAQSSSPEAARELGAEYAIAILGITMINSNGLPMNADPAETSGDVARNAVDELAASTNVDVLEAAGNLLFQYGSIIQAIGKGAIDREPLAERLLLKVQGQAPGNFVVPRLLADLYKARALKSREPGALRQWLTESTMAADRADAAPDTFPLIVESRPSLRLGAARAAFETGELDMARRMAQAALAQVGDEHDVKNGQAVHDGHAVLGRVALAGGRVEDAKAQLLRAGQVAGGGVLTSFGPNMSLAKELLEHGERDTVISYLAQCRSFWKNPRLDEWIRTIQEGKSPNFGANLVY